MSPTKRKEIDETGDVASAEKLSAAREKIVSQLGRIIVGQDNAIEELLIALFAGGHCLLVGVPGLAKTLMLSS